MQKWQSYYSTKEQAILDYAYRYRQGQGIGINEVKRVFQDTHKDVLEELAEEKKLIKKGHLYYSIKQPTLEEYVKGKLQSPFDTLNKAEVCSNLNIPASQLQKVLDKLIADNHIELCPFNPSNYRLKEND